LHRFEDIESQYLTPHLSTGTFVCAPASARLNVKAI